MSDKSKNGRNSEQQVHEFSERRFRDYAPITPHVQNSNPKSNDDGTKETIRNRNNNQEEA